MPRYQNCLTRNRFMTKEEGNVNCVACDKQIAGCKLAETVTYIGAPQFIGLVMVNTDYSKTMIKMVKKINYYASQCRVELLTDLLPNKDRLGYNNEFDSTRDYRYEAGFAVRFRAIKYGSRDMIKFSAIKRTAIEDLPHGVQCFLGGVKKDSLVMWKQSFPQEFHLGYAVNSKNRRLYDRFRFAYPSSCEAFLTLPGETRELPVIEDEDEQNDLALQELKKCHRPDGTESECAGTVSAFAQGNPFSLPASCLDVYVGDCSMYTKCLDKIKGCGASGYALGFGYFFCEAFKEKDAWEAMDAAGQKWALGTQTCLQRSIIQSGLLETQPATCSAIKDTAFALHGACYVRNDFCDIIFGNIEVIYSVLYDSTVYGDEAWAQVCDALRHCAATDNNLKVRVVWAAFEDQCPMVPKSRSGGASSNQMSYSVFPNGMELACLKDTPWGAFDVSEYADPFRDDWVAPVVDGCEPSRCCGRGKGGVICNAVDDSVLPTNAISRYYTAGDFMSSFEYKEGSDKGMIIYSDDRITTRKKMARKNQFFRLDARIVECVDRLQSAYFSSKTVTGSDAYDSLYGIDIKTAYRTKREALAKFALNPHTETYPSRFQTGAAVRVEFSADSQAMDVPLCEFQTLCLQGSVGKMGKNDPSDVKLVADRLKELGYGPFLMQCLAALPTFSLLEGITYRHVCSCTQNQLKFASDLVKNLIDNPNVGIAGLQRLGSFHGRSRCSSALLHPLARTPPSSRGLCKLAMTRTSGSRQATRQGGSVCLAGTPALALKTTTNTTGARPGT